MKAITHNILMCNTKKCSGTDKNYPLIIKPTDITSSPIQFVPPVNPDINISLFSDIENSGRTYMLKGYVKRIGREGLTQLAYNYEGDWKELMEDEDESIYAMVKELKERSDDRV